MTVDQSPIPPASFRALPRRDRITIAIGLGGTTAVAWTYLVVMALRMSDMHGMHTVVQIPVWDATDFALMFVMWAVMMVGMMVPTATPMTLIYAAVARKASREGAPIASTAVFVAGYVTVWTGFSAAATVAQWALDRAALLSLMMVANSPWLGAGILIAAGVYQLTPAKEACLRHCRAPARFIAEFWRPGAAGAFRMGVIHGCFCLGCCWALMLLLFVGGVMNLLWIAAIALFVLGEKVLPLAHASRLTGAAMILAGVLFAALW